MRGWGYILLTVSKTKPVQQTRNVNPQTDRPQCITPMLPLPFSLGRISYFLPTPLLKVAEQEINIVGVKLARLIIYNHGITPMRAMVIYLLWLTKHFMIFSLSVPKMMVTWENGKYLKHIDTAIRAAYTAGTMNWYYIISTALSSI